MRDFGPSILIAAGVLSVCAGLAHIACILIGARAYRFMGAGERMARAVESGSHSPAVVTSLIAATLFLWGAYALSAAGLFIPLPFTGAVLAAVALLLVVRAMAFPLLRPAFPENSTTFWLASSAICLVMGLLFAAGALYVAATG